MSSGASNRPSGIAAAQTLLVDSLAPLRCETVRILHLDRAGLMIGLTSSDGDPASVPLPMRALVTDALRLGSAALILAHNHPSGCAQPSHADCLATRALAELLQAIGVRLLDHLVVASDAWSSFVALGLL